jgi:hypothetical protein
MSALNKTAKWVAFAAGAAAAGYATYVGVTWARYGNPARGRPEEQDDLLDRFIPRYDIVERHHIAVDAPADVTFEVSKLTTLSASPVARAIFRGRELLMGASGTLQRRDRGILEETLSLGWGVLAEIPGREIVVGAVTQPWHANVTFRSLSPDDFATFDEPAYVKIAWTLRADPLDDNHSIFRTETRAVATDAFAREKFRLYWSCLSPGIILIRRAMLGPVKRTAERAHGYYSDWVG